MSRLENSEVWRGGRTSPTISQEKHIGNAERIELQNGHSLQKRREKGISLSFGIASKGGGVTDLYLFIPEADFSEIELAIKRAREDRTRA